MACHVNSLRHCTARTVGFPAMRRTHSGRRYNSGFAEPGLHAEAALRIFLRILFYITLHIIILRNDIT
jgi:hypothetical protein